MPVKTREQEEKELAEWWENHFYPKVTPRIEQGREYWTLHIDQCPRCGGKSLHGGGPLTDRPYGGYRIAHCCRGILNLVIPDEWRKEKKL